MIPNYQKFIAYQDKRVIALFYLIIFIVLAFYWKNTDFNLSPSSLWPMTGLLTALLFKFTSELKSYWAYSYTIGRVDLTDFKRYQKKSSKIANIINFLYFLIGVLGIFIIVKIALTFLPKSYSFLFIYLMTPLYIYFIYKRIREIVINALLGEFPARDKYINLYQYVLLSILITLVINGLSIQPLASHPEFSLEEGFNSIRLMIAMCVLCAIVMLINLIFINWAKRYIFLGRIFLKEINFTFSQSVPFHWLQTKSKLIKGILLSIALVIWITFISILFALIQLNVNFTSYFLVCFAPCIVFYFLQLYWFYHSEFMMACDMYLRFQESEQRKS